MKVYLINKYGAKTGDWFNPDAAKAYRQPERMDMIERQITTETLYCTSRRTWILKVEPFDMLSCSATYRKISPPRAYHWLVKNDHEIPSDLKDYGPRDREV
jgi:hypothetical protein